MTITTIDVIASPLRHLDADAVSRAARAETRNREVYLPPVSVFRWWARRTEAVNGAVIDAVTAERGSDEPLLDCRSVRRRRRHSTSGADSRPPRLRPGHQPLGSGRLDRDARTPGTSSNPGGRGRSRSADHTASQAPPTAPP